MRTPVPRQPHFLVQATQVPSRVSSAACATTGRTSDAMRKTQGLPLSVRLRGHERPGPTPLCRSSLSHRWVSAPPGTNAVCSDSPAGPRGGQADKRPKMSNHDGTCKGSIVRPKNQGQVAYPSGFDRLPSTGNPISQTTEYSRLTEHGRFVVPYNGCQSRCSSHPQLKLCNIVLF